jgi:hypothetical protein
VKRTQLNVALAVAAVGLGAALFFGQKKEEPGPPLTPLANDAVTRVAIEHPGSPAIRLEKQDGQWRLTEPVKTEADELEVNAPVSLATQETKDKVEGGQLAELGLAPPTYTITLNDTPIAFGGVEPLQYRRYVKVGEAVSLIEDPPSAALDKDYSDLVAKNLFPANAEIERVELKRLTLAKGAEGHWTVSPADPDAGADQMQKLADGWKNARSMWNELAKAPVKGDPVKVTLKDGTVREFVVAATEPQLKLHRPDLGVTFVMSKALADELLKLPALAKEDPAQEPAK